MTQPFLPFTRPSIDADSIAYLGGNRRVRVMTSATAGLEMERTVRGDGVRAKTFTGKTDDLNQLVVAAAKHVYSEAQPVLWAIYPEDALRQQEEVDFIKSIFAGADPAGRPYLLKFVGQRSPADRRLSARLTP